MLHRDMIGHVRDAFDALFTTRTVIGIGQLKEEWLVSIRDEQPRWVGPEMAATLLKHVGNGRSALHACERIARLYAEMLKYNWGRGPYLPSVIKEITRTVHAAVSALAEPAKDRKANWDGANIAADLIHAFRKILYPNIQSTNSFDAIWSFLATSTLPLRNQSSRATKHEDTWFDMMVRIALLRMCKEGATTGIDWRSAFKAREQHPDLQSVLLAQIQAAERAGQCSEKESDAMRVAMGMCTRPDGQMGADFDCLADVSIDDLLTEAAEQATPEKVKPKRVRPIRSNKKPVVANSVEHITEEPEPEPDTKTRRLVSALDAREGWRRNDGTLYTYYRVTSGKATCVANGLSKPVLTDPSKFTLDDLQCTDESPLSWADGPLPHEAARIFAPISATVDA